jgi:hypothetical protein
MKNATWYPHVAFVFGGLIDGGAAAAKNAV